MGLRERKKERTRAELQRHALRLFRDHGYAVTTVDDIAAAAEVSRSTFFRYFPTKEDVVLFDDVDPVMERVAAELPAGTPLLEAVRRILRDSFGSLDDEARALEEVRMELARTIPEIAAILRVRHSFGVEQIAGMVARGVGRTPDDPEVLLFAGVVIGARHAAVARVQSGGARSYLHEVDAMLARLEGGIPLADEPIVRPPSPPTSAGPAPNASPAGTGSTDAAPAPGR